MKVIKQKKFAKGFCFTKIFIFFILGSLFGGLWERIIIFFQTGEWTRRYDMLCGPFTTLYGFGFVIYLLLFLKDNENRSFLKTLFLASLVGGIFEYLVGWIIEITMSIKFWDYSDMALNIHGRTTIPIMLVWGIGGTILLKFVYPFLSKLIEKIPFKIGYPVFVIVLIFMIINMIVSYSSFLRMFFRSRGEVPKTIIGEMFDYFYDDEYMLKKFPILKGKF